MDKTTDTMGRVWIFCMKENFASLPDWWVLLPFFAPWKIDGETRALLMWWSIPQERKWMDKRHSYYRKKYNYQFPRLFPCNGFLVFSRAMGNSWENSCIFHTSRFTNIFTVSFRLIWKYFSKQKIIGNLSFK